jgi:hypothetical protein
MHCFEVWSSGPVNGQLTCGSRFKYGRGQHRAEACYFAILDVLSHPLFVQADKLKLVLSMGFLPQKIAQVSRFLYRIYLCDRLRPLSSAFEQATTPAHLEGVITTLDDLCRTRCRQKWEEFRPRVVAQLVAGMLRREVL